MGCNEMEALFMRYMDNTLTEAEGAVLREHVALCRVCDEDFKTYTLMFNGFRETEIIEAPAGFEAAVMVKVKCLPMDSQSVLDKTFCAASGLVLVSLGITVLMFGVFGTAAGQGAEAGVLAQSNGLSFLQSFGSWIGTNASNFKNMLSLAVDGLYYARYLFVGIIAVLAAVQVLMSGNGKIRA